MSDQKREKLTRLVTPAGIAVYPHLHAPDTKFNKSEYKVKLTIEAEEAKAFIERLKPEFAKAKAMVPEKAAAAKKKPTRQEPWEEQEDGSFTFGAFTMKSHGVSAKGEKWERAPFIFDAAKQKLPDGTKIGGGSILKISTDVLPYYMATEKKYGVKLYLVAVQVLDLKTFGGSANASDFGFEEEEDGFRADFSADSFDDDDDADTGSDDDSDEDSDEEYDSEDF